MFWHEHSYVAYSTTYVGYLTLHRKSAFLHIMLTISTSRILFLSALIVQSFNNLHNNKRSIQWWRHLQHCCLFYNIMNVIVGVVVLRCNIQFSGQNYCLFQNCPILFISPNFLSCCLQMNTKLLSLFCNTTELHPAVMDSCQQVLVCFQYPSRKYQLSSCAAKLLQDFHYELSYIMEDPFF